MNDKTHKDCSCETIFTIVRALYREFTKQAQTFDITYSNLLHILNAFNCQILHPVYEHRLKDGEHPKIVKRHIEIFTNTLNENLNTMIDMMLAGNKEIAMTIQYDDTDPKGAA